MVDLSAFLNSINKTKKNLLKDPENDPQYVEKEYKKLGFVINRIFSYFPDTIYFAQEMNKRSSLDGIPQYFFYLYGLSARPRFSRGIKADNLENLDVVKEFYNYSTKKAREALQILTEKDIEYIKQRLNKGGVLRKKKGN